MDSSAENGFAKAKLDNIQFYSCYALPSLSLNEFTGFLDRLTKDVKEHSLVAIAGDFNAWAVEWGSRETNAKGQALLEAMSSLDVVLLNSGDGPTFARGGASSVVDLTFVSSNLARRNCSWKTTDVCTASDHCAITWSITTNTRRRGSTPKKLNSHRWKVSTFDPVSFRLLALDERPARGNNATEKADDVIRRVATACDATMLRKQGASQLPPTYWWSDTIAVLRKEYVQARKLSQRGRKKPNAEELEVKCKEARRKFTKAIKSSKKQCWDELLDEVERDPWGRPYKVTL